MVGLWSSQVLDQIDASVSEITETTANEHSSEKHAGKIII
jgi:hypothetical protein